MKLFESAWRSKYEFFERYYDTDLNRSLSRKIDLPYEWYEPSSRGLYESILDSEIKLDKKQGKARDGRDNYGFIDPIYRSIRDNYWGKNSYNLNPRIFYLDIETRSGQNSVGFPTPEKALEEISLIQFYDNIEKTLFVLGSRDWKHQSDYEFDFDVKYINCQNETKLIQAFLTLFEKLNPLIIYAWFGDGFDFPYIYNRLKKLGFDTNKLSNYGETKLDQSENKGKIEFNFSSDGHFFLDLMEIYKKYTFDPRPSYSLDTIAEIELKKNKVLHTEYVNFDDFYTSKNYVINETKCEDSKREYIRQLNIKKNNMINEFKRRNLELPKNIPKVD